MMELYLRSSIRHHVVMLDELSTGITYSLIHQWLYSPLLGPGLFFSLLIIITNGGMTPWAGDQPVARPLPTHRTTQTQNKRTHRHPCL
jgi:hypothetical protein